MYCVFLVGSSGSTTTPVPQRKFETIDKYKLNIT